eukprot:1003046-Lingulodinium_polyedra.AAC.1
MELAEIQGAGPGVGNQLTRIGLQDDITLIGKASCLKEQWNGIEGALSRSGHRLRLHKCKVWVPGLDE